MSERVLLRLWGGTVIEAVALRRRWCLVLLVWLVRETWGGKPFRSYYDSGWRPAWRTFDPKELAS